MTQTPREEADALARSSGFTALAADGALGEVETPLFPPDSGEPDYLLVRMERGSRRLRRPVVPTALVAAVDPDRQLVYLAGTLDELSHLPESLPLTGRGKDKRLRE